MCIRDRHSDGRVGDGLAEQRLCVGAERLFDLLLLRVRVHEGTFDAELLQRDRKQVHRTAVNGGGGDKMVARGADVQNRKQTCLLYTSRCV